MASMRGGLHRHLAHVRPLLLPHNPNPPSRPPTHAPAHRPLPPPFQLIMRKTGEETRKRSLVVRDDSGRSIEVTLWGDFVTEPGDRLEQVRRGCRRS